MKIKIKYFFNYFEKYIKQFFFVFLSLIIIGGGFILLYLSSLTEFEQTPIQIVLLVVGLIISFISPPVSLCLYSRFFL
ncbi:MAG: hypothetical protein ACRC4M_02690 [Mycoplasma sp.]